MGVRIIVISTTMIINTNMEITKLLHMFQISDSLFPIGSFTLSNGLETFVQKEKIRTAQDLRQYVKNYISFMPYNELGILFLIQSIDLDEKKLIELDQIYSALRSPREMREGSEKLCKRFLKVWEKIEKLSYLERYKELIEKGLCDGHHCIAVSLFILDKEIAIEQGACIFAYSTISSMITNAVKLVPLSQLDGQQVLNELIPQIEQAVQNAKKTKITELGIGGTGFELLAYQHETLYSRLYMS